MGRQLGVRAARRAAPVRIAGRRAVGNALRRDVLARRLNVARISAAACYKAPVRRMPPHNTASRRPAWPLTPTLRAARAAPPLPAHTDVTMCGLRRAARIAAQRQGSRGRAPLLAAHGRSRPALRGPPPPPAAAAGARCPLPPARGAAGGQRAACADRPRESDRARAAPTRSRQAPSCAVDPPPPSGVLQAPAACEPGTRRDPAYIQPVCF